MCEHISTLWKKRNAIVALRESLGDILLRSPLSEELSRHENFYEYWADRYEDLGYTQCCESESYKADPEKFNRYWEQVMCKRVIDWRK